MDGPIRRGISLELLSMQFAKMMEKRLMELMITTTMHSAQEWPTLTSHDERYPYQEDAIKVLDVREGDSVGACEGR